MDKENQFFDLIVMADLLMQSKQFEEALRILDEFQTDGLLKSDTASYYLKKAVILFNLDQPNRALEMTDKAEHLFLQVFGTSGIGRMHCNILKSAACFELAQPNDALAFIRIAEDCIPDRNTIHYLDILLRYVRIFNAIGKQSDAEEYLKKYMEVYIKLSFFQLATMDVEERIGILGIMFEFQAFIYNYLREVTHISDTLLKEILDFRVLTKWVLLERIHEGGSLSDLYSRLQDHEAAIEIIRVPEIKKRGSDNIHYLFFIITSQNQGRPKLVTHSFIKTKEYDILSFYERSILTKSVDFETYTALWSVLEQHLAGIKKIYFSADGIYRSINPEILRDPEGVYLFDRFEFSFHHDLRRLFSNKTTNPDTTKTALLVGDISYDDYPLLPASIKELETAKNLLSPVGYNCTLLTEINATVESIMEYLPSSILHISSHGFFRKTEDVRSPDSLLASSGIILHDSELCSGDILSHDLTETELVILSACDSRKSLSLEIGDAFGFERTFFLAGARNLLASQWEVEDQTAQEILRLFYLSYLVTGNVGTSIRSAKAEIKKKKKNPYYWGVFMAVQK